MDHAVTVICTDQGQHPVTVLGDLAVSSGLLRANVGGVYGAIADRRKGDCVQLDDIRRPDYRVRMWCPRCNRRPQVRGEKVREVIERLAVAEITQLDLSRLP